MTTPFWRPDGTYELPADVAEEKRAMQVVERGGEGSGNFGHAGRPGQVGGSAPSGETPEVEPLGVDRVPYGSRRPSADFGMRDLQDSAKRVTEASIRKDYASNSPKDPAIYESWVPMEDVPSEVLAEEEDGEAGNYDWEQYSPRDTFPPVKLLVTSEGDVEILDGNHRIRYWRESGMEYVPAWVVDYSMTQDDYEGLVERGGPGSGHHGHKGRPGVRGGSLPGEGGGAKEGKKVKRPPFDPAAHNDIRAHNKAARNVLLGVFEEAYQRLGFAPRGITVSRSAKEFREHLLRNMEGYLRRVQERRLSGQRFKSVPMAVVSMHGKPVEDILITALARKVDWGEGNDFEKSFAHEVGHLIHSWYELDDKAILPDGIPQEYVASLRGRYPQSKHLNEYVADLTALILTDDLQGNFLPRVYETSPTTGKLTANPESYLAASDVDRANAGRLLDALQTAIADGRYQANTVPAVMLEANPPPPAPEPIEQKSAPVGLGWLAIFDWGEGMGELLPIDESDVPDLPPGTVVIPPATDERDEWVVRGGPGSGHFGHEGRPGQRGGSQPGESMPNDAEESELSSLRESLRGKQDLGIGDIETVRRFWSLDMSRHAGRPIEFVYGDIGDGVTGWTVSDALGNKLTVQMSEARDDKTGRREHVLTYIRANNKGTGLGTAFMETMKDYADVRGLPFRVGFVASDFYTKFDWLERDPEQVSWTDIPGWSEARNWVYDPTQQAVTRGGPGSGHHGHKGRPGERGGSLPGEGPRYLVDKPENERRSGTPSPSGGVVRTGGFLEPGHTIYAFFSAPRGENRTFADPAALEIARDLREELLDFRDRLTAELTHEEFPDFPTYRLHVQTADEAATAIPNGNDRAKLWILGNIINDLEEPIFSPDLLVRRDARGNIEAVAAYQSEERRVYVEFLFGNGGGAGSKAMFDVLDIANAEDKAVELVAIEGARPFYLKLGFEPKYPVSNQMVLSAEKVKQLYGAETMVRRSALPDALRLELEALAPEDDLWVIPSAAAIYRVGNARSGHWGHKGRPGQRGGSQPGDGGGAEGEAPRKEKGITRYSPAQVSALKQALIDTTSAKVFTNLYADINDIRKAWIAPDGTVLSLGYKPHGYVASDFGAVGSDWHHGQQMDAAMRAAGIKPLSRTESKAEDMGVANDRYWNIVRTANRMGFVRVFHAPWELSLMWEGDLTPEQKDTVETLMFARARSASVAGRTGGKLVIDHVVPGEAYQTISWEFLEPESGDPSELPSKARALIGRSKRILPHEIAALMAGGIINRAAGLLRRVAPIGDGPYVVVKGGPGSGHFGHKGRPGERGGSLPGEGGGDERRYMAAGKGRSYWKGMASEHTEAWAKWRADNKAVIDLLPGQHYSSGWFEKVMEEAGVANRIADAARPRTRTTGDSPFLTPHNLGTTIRQVLHQKSHSEHDAVALARLWLDVTERSIDDADAVYPGTKEYLASALAETKALLEDLPETGRPAIFNTEPQIKAAIELASYSDLFDDPLERGLLDLAIYYQNEVSTRYLQGGPATFRGLETEGLLTHDMADALRTEWVRRHPGGEGIAEGNENLKDWTDIGVRPREAVVAQALFHDGLQWIPMDEGGKQEPLAAAVNDGWQRTLASPPAVLVTEVAADKWGGEPVPRDRYDPRVDTIGVYAEAFRPPEPGSLLPEGVANRGDRVYLSEKPVIDLFYEMPHIREQAADLLESSEQRTQEWFADAGFKPTDTLRVYRGLKPKEDYGSDEEVDAWRRQWNPDNVVGGVANVEMYSLSSWTLNPETAYGFSDIGHAQSYGAVLAADIPISRIVGTSATGWPCASESELIIKGGDPIKAAVIDARTIRREMGMEGVEYSRYIPMRGTNLTTTANNLLTARADLPTIYPDESNWHWIAEWTEEEYGLRPEELDASRFGAAPIINRGGPGSGHWGHAGRPGERGGSQPGQGGAWPRYLKDSEGLHYADYGFKGKAFKGGIKDAQQANSWGLRACGEAKDWIRSPLELETTWVEAEHGGHAPPEGEGWVWSPAEDWDDPLEPEWHNPELAKQEEMPDEADDFIDNHVENTYSWNNGMLRRPFETNPENLEQFRTSIAAMDVLMDKSKLPEAVVAWRGMGDWANRLRPGREFTDKGYTSTTLLSSVIGEKPYDDYGNGGRPYDWKFAVQVPRGTMGYYVGREHGNGGVTWKEYELMLDRGTKFRVLSIDRENKTGVLRVIGQQRGRVP